MSLNIKSFITNEVSESCEKQCEKYIKQHRWYRSELSDKARVKSGEIWEQNG